MTLEESIRHCEEIAYQKDLESGFETDNERYVMTDKERADCKECAKEHRQLAEWLRELKAWRTFGLRVGEIVALYLPQEELNKLEQKISEAHKEDSDEVSD